MVNPPEELATKLWLGHPVLAHRGRYPVPTIPAKLLCFPHSSAARVPVLNGKLKPRMDANERSPRENEDDVTPLPVIYSAHDE